MVPAAYDRRTFLRRAGVTGAAATAVLLGAPRPPARADESLAPFVHGVASGDPLADRVILWTRVTTDRPGKVPVKWRVAKGPDMTEVVSSGTVTTDASVDHTVKVDATGLEPGTYYFYEFEAPDGERSLIGRTKTAPDGPVDHLRFGVVSCSNWDAGFFNAYARLAERDDLDAVVHTGDYIYEYGAGVYGPGGGDLDESRGLQEPEHEIVTLADYRTRHAHYKLDPDLRRLHQLFPFITTWDDHESANNSWRDGAENHTEGEEGEWAARKAASQRAYDEWMPLRTSDAGPARIWRSFRYGDLADIIVLDTRLERDQQTALLGTEESPVTLTVQDGATIDDPDRVMVSEEQREFLLGELRASSARGARWRIIAQQVVMAHWDAGGLPRYPVDTPDFPVFLRDGGNAANPDAWDGYTAERDRVFDHLMENGIDNVVVLTGDVHTSWANDLTPDPHNPAAYDPVTGDGAIGVEFVCPSVTSANLDAYPREPDRVLERLSMAHNPHIKWQDFYGHGYYVLDVTPDAAQSDWYFVDTVLEPTDAESLAASWKTTTGTNRLVEAEGAAAEGDAAPHQPPAEPSASGSPNEGVAAGSSSGSADADVLPATGGSLGLTGGVAVFGAAGLARLLRRRSDLSSR